MEAISPTIPDHIQQEDQQFRATKDELLQQISKVDRQISKTESEITKLRSKQKELEVSASKPASKSDVEEEAQPQHQSLAQKIYADNRKKANTAHAKLDNLGPKVIITKEEVGNGFERREFTAVIDELFCAPVV